jgi:hypothetical protein
MPDCNCCGQPSYAAAPTCRGCQDGCDPLDTWHCFTGHCDGSECGYPGECQGWPHPVYAVHP